MIDHIECRYSVRSYSISVFFYTLLEDGCEGFGLIQIFSMMVSFFNPVNASSEEASMVPGG